MSRLQMRGTALAGILLAWACCIHAAAADASQTQVPAAYTSPSSASAATQTAVTQTKVVQAALSPRGTPQPASCTTNFLNSDLFNRQDPHSITNAYLALLLARYSYPTAFGITSASDKTQQTYQELYGRKWSAMGAKNDTIQFLDVEAPIPALGLLTNNPEAHAVVFATDIDVFIAFRGLTNIESGMTQNANYLPVNGTFAKGQYLPVHSGFYGSFVSVWPQVEKAVDAALNRTADPSKAMIYLTGHSMGAALAVFTAMRLKDLGNTIGGVYAFGAPRMGQQTFIDAYEATGLPAVTVHWWNELDLIPVMKPPLRATTPPYVQLPSETQYRIWQGQCGKAQGMTALACPVDASSTEMRCRNNLNDHFAFTYIMNMQGCLLKAPEVANNACVKELVLATM